MGTPVIWLWAGFILLILALLAALRQPAYAVLGNHDHRHDLLTVRETLAQAGVIELPNRVHTVRRDGAALHFAGVDDVAHMRARLDHVQGV